MIFAVFDLSVVAFHRKQVYKLIFVGLHLYVYNIRFVWYT